MIRWKCGLKNFLPENMFANAERLLPWISFINLGIFPKNKLISIKLCQPFKAGMPVAIIDNMGQMWKHVTSDFFEVIITY